jgi:hypothetical protein
MRIALLLSSLTLAACTVGEVGMTSSNNNGPDAGMGNDGGSGSGSNKDPNACLDKQATPTAETDHSAPVVAGNKTNAGQNCIVAGCHQNNALGSGAPGFQFAGTVYKAGTTQPNPGIAVRVVSGATVLTTYTDAAGNFYFPAGSLSGTFTATTSVSSCPTITKMVTTLAGGNGAGPGVNSCNLCHAATGGTTTPISM